MSEQTQMRRWTIWVDGLALDSYVSGPETEHPVDVVELAPIVEGLRALVDALVDPETGTLALSYEGTQDAVEDFEAALDDARALLLSLSPTDEQTRPQGGDDE